MSFQLCLIPFSVVYSFKDFYATVLYYIIIVFCNRERCFNIEQLLTESVIEGALLCVGLGPFVNQCCISVGA